jgi:hypothetical protein
LPLHRLRLRRPIMADPGRSRVVVVIVSAMHRPSPQ